MAASKGRCGAERGLGRGLHGPLRALIPGPARICGRDVRHQSRSDTAKYIAKAEKIVKAAENHGMQVVRIYSPHATWQRVVDAANGADLFVYIGHGNGWPSPHANNPVTKNGLGLNPYDN